MFWQNLFAAIMVFTYTLAKKRKLPKTKKLPTHFVRCAVAISAGLILFYTLSHVKLNLATAISFTAPLVTSIFAVIFFGEKMGYHRFIGLIIGLVGVLVILRPGTEFFDPKMLLMLIVVVFWAITDLVIKLLNKTESLNSMLFYMTLVMLLYSLPLGMFFWEDINLKQVLLLLLLTCLHLTNFATVSLAYRDSDVSVLMPFDYSRLIFSAIISYVFFAEGLSIWTAIGSFIIISSAVYVAYREKKHRQKISTAIVA